MFHHEKCSLMRRIYENHEPIFFHPEHEIVLFIIPYFFFKPVIHYSFPENKQCNYKHVYDFMGNVLLQLNMDQCQCERSFLNIYKFLNSCKHIWCKEAIRQLNT